MKRRDKARDSRRVRRSPATPRRPAGRAAAPLQCPACARAFLIDSDFVPDTVATGRTWPSGRAELRCGICKHVWWSKEPEALRRARMARTRSP